MAEPHDIGLEAGKDIEEVNKTIPDFGVTPLQSPILPPILPQLAQTPNQFATTAPSLPPLSLPATLPATAAADRETQLAKQQQSKALLTKFIGDVNGKLLTRYPILNQVPGLSEQLSKMAIFGLYQKKKDRIFGLLHSVLSRSITPEVFVQSYAAEFKHANAITPEKEKALVHLLNNYAHFVEVASEALPIPQQPSPTPSSASTSLSTATTTTSPTTGSKTKKDKEKKTKPKPKIKSAVEKAWELAVKAQKKTEKQNLIAAAKKAAAEKKAEEKRKITEAKKLAKKLEKEKLEKEKLLNKKPPVPKEKKVTEKKVPDVIFVKTPAPPKPPAAPKAKKLPPKPPVPPKPPPKKEVEPSTEFGGALRPEEADTLAQGGIDEDDEESALIDYGPMRPISNKNHLEHETLFLERTPLETIVKHLVSENLGACAMVEEDALRYVSDATEQFLMDTMEDMIRIHQHRSTSVYNRSRAQSTSNPQAQLLALAQLDRSERSKRKADDAFPSVAINNKTAFQRPKISKEDFWLRAKNNPSTVGGRKTGSLFKRMLEAKN